MFKETDFNSVGRMDAISLDEMSSVSLMNRIDTKFVTTVQVLEHVLDDALYEGYRICEISGRRLMPYSSVYYDTDDLKMFTAHRNGKKTRQKVRVRTYLSDNESFLEIKRKNNRGRTKKKRIAIDESYFARVSESAEAAAFLRERANFAPEIISPALITKFDRITLVNHAHTERLTIDMNLRFVNMRAAEPCEAKIDRMVIVELKQDGLCYSPMKEILLDLRVKTLKVSKYCVGTALSNPTVKANRFKRKIRLIHKTIAEQSQF